MKKYIFTSIFILLVSFYLAVAGGKGLDIKMYGYLITFEKKDNQFEVVRKSLPEKVVPKNIIEYQIVVKNPTDKTFRNVFIKARIPEGTEYVKNSATEGALFSIDKGKTYHKPPVKYRIKENGKEIEKIATPDMYTNIGWNIEVIKPKEEKKFIYWVKVK